MRLKLNIKLNKVPAFYRIGISSFIIDILRKSEKQFLNSNKINKSFSFSVNFNDVPSISQENIQIDDKLLNSKIFNFENKIHSLTISSSDDILMNFLKTALLYVDTFKLGENEDFLLNNQKILIEIEEPQVIKERNFIDADYQEFITSSPIILENNIDFRRIPANLENIIDFNKILNQVENKKMNKLADRDLKRNLRLEPIEMTKTIEYYTFKSFRNGSKYPIMSLTANSGYFKLYGHKDDIALIYQNGLGDRNSSGFGLIA